jgi:hypothetical protein
MAQKAAKCIILLLANLVANVTLRFRVDLYGVQVHDAFDHRAGTSANAVCFAKARARVFWPKVSESAAEQPRPSRLGLAAASPGRSMPSPCILLKVLRKSTFPS